MMIAFLILKNLGGSVFSQEMKNFLSSNSTANFVGKFVFVEIINV